MLLYLLMGIAAYLFAGDSLGQWTRHGDYKLYALGIIESVVGTYFMIAAISSI